MASRIAATRIFGAPMLIAVLSLAGLIAALVGGDPTDAVAWIGLAVPIIAVMWAMGRRRR